MIGEVTLYSRWALAGQGQDGVYETMWTGRVICVLSREIVGNSTSAVQTSFPGSVYEPSVRFGIGSSQERTGNF